MTTMLVELEDYLRECDKRRHAVLELELQRLLRLGVPQERMVIRAQMGRHGCVYSVHVKSDDELWLDWLSANH